MRKLRKFFKGRRNDKGSSLPNNRLGKAVFYALMALLVGAIGYYWIGDFISRM